MMKIYAVLIFLGSSFFSMAQFNFPVSADSMRFHNRLEMDGSLDVQGTSIQRDLFRTLFFGGTIDASMKDASFDRHSEINRFGINSNNEVRYYHGSGKIFKKDRLTWAVKAGYYAVGNLTYGRDAFGLVFYGNESYLGNTAVFTNSRLNFTQFQKIGFGLFNKFSGVSAFVNVVNVQNALDGFVRKGRLEQSSDGTQVDLTLNGEMKTTTGNAFSKGIGLAIDLDYRFDVPWRKDSKATFQFMVQNMGFAYMHAGQTSYEVDSVYSYSGFRFNQLTAGSTAFGDDFSLLDSLGVAKTTSNRWIKLPGYFQAMKLVNFQSQQKLQSFFGIRLYPTLNSIPSIFAGLFWKPAAKIGISTSVAYGGFGKFRAGMYATFTAQRFQWSVGTEDILGVFSSTALSQSVLTRIAWRLN